jgi:hypothetical protein
MCLSWDDEGEWGIYGQLLGINKEGGRLKKRARWYDVPQELLSDVELSPLAAPAEEDSKPAAAAAAALTTVSAGEEEPLLLGELRGVRLRGRAVVMAKRVRRRVRERGFILMAEEDCF